MAQRIVFLRVLRATCTTACIVALAACGRTGSAAGAVDPPSAAKTDDGITVAPEMLS